MLGFEVPLIVPLVSARSALALSGPARTVSRCLAATRTAYPRTSRPVVACELRPAALPSARRPALQLTSRAALPLGPRTALPCSPARRALLPCPASAPLSCALRPAAARALRPSARASHPTASRVAPYCSPRPHRPALPSHAAQAEPCRPARAALPNPSHTALPHSPAPPSCPAATTAAVAARATAADGGGATGSAGGAASAGGARGAAGSAGGAASAGAARGGQQRSLPLPDDPTPQQLREWVIQRGSPSGGGFGFMGVAQRRQQRPRSTFSLQWPRDCASQRCVPGCVEAAATGASESAAALGARESADALGASASTATGPASAEALHTFTLDSGASRCFFRDCNTATPLAAPVPISLADPTGGPVVARASIVLPCLAVPSRSLSGLHLPAFSTNLLSNAVLQDEWVDTFILGGQRVAIYKCSRTGRHLATFTRQPGSSPYTLTTGSAQVAESGEVAASSRVSVSGQLAASCSSCTPVSLSLGFPAPCPPSRACLHRCAFPASKGWQRAAPHFSEFPLTTAPLQTLHMDVWGPAPVGGTDQERYFLLVVDERSEFSSGLLEELCQDEGIRQTFTLPASLQQNGIAERRIGLIMEFYDPHSRRVFSSQDVTFDESVCFYRLHPHASHPGPVPSGVSQVEPPPFVEPLEISFDSSSLVEGGEPAADDMAANLRPPHLENPPGFPPRPSLPPEQPASVDSGAETAGVEPGGAETEGEGSGGAATGGAATRGAVSKGAATEGADSWDATCPSGGGAVGDPAGGPRAGQLPQPDLLETHLPQAIRAWIVRRGSAGGGGYSPAGAGAASPGGSAGAVGARGTARGAGSAAGAGGTRGAAGAGGAIGTGCAGASGAGGAAGTVCAGAEGTADGTGTAPHRPFFYPQPQSSLPLPDSALRQVLSLSSSTGLTPPLLCPPTDQPQLLLRSPLPAPTPHTEVTKSLTERREPESRASTLVRARRVAHPRPPAVPGTHSMALRPSSVPQRVVLPKPPASSLPHVPDPESDLARAASPTVTRLLTTVITDPEFESTAAFALVTELVDFAARSRLDYVASLNTESASVCPSSVRGEPALSSDVLEDRQFELECLAAALPRFASMLLCPKGDPDALDIPTPRSYAEAIADTYVDEVPPPGPNIVDGMWIFRVKQPPGSPPAFKARFVARGFSQRQGVELFQKFSPTPKMTTLRVLLHVAAKRDYELHSLNFSTAFLQGSLHEEIWLRRPPGFTGSSPVGTQWSLRRPVYGLRLVPREWHDTLRTTLAALGFAPSSPDTSLLLRTDTSGPPFYVLVYVDDLVFAAADTKALSLVKAELQERHTSTDLGELRSYLGLHITRDRARHTINLTQSHMVHQVLQRFGFKHSLPQPTPLSTGHSLSAPPLDESVEPSGPYPELVGCLICEAEIYDGAMAAQELHWLTYLLTDLGERPRSPPVLYVDNKAMLA
ncbi:unnamed protein product [Closterium sp. NIES-53]